MRSANKLPCAVLVLMACGLAAAQEVQLLVQRSPLAGYRYYEAPALAGMLRPGERLDLIREPENPHDANAVRVEWQGRKLGYVPRTANAALAWSMDGGQEFLARVVADGVRRSRRGRIAFEVLMR